VKDVHDYDEIWRADGATLWRAILAYAGGRRDVADDAVAEAFTRAIDAGATVREPLPYLYRIAFRVAAAELRSREATPGIRERAVEVDHEALADLVAAMRRLSPSQRAAVYLHYQADLSVRDVATLMGTSPAAVKVHLMRGRRRLASLLGSEER
jgi:RNA polymerase sigma-70 factor (ECF subfamily)